MKLGICRCYREYISRVCADEYMNFFSDQKAIAEFYKKKDPNRRDPDAIDERFRHEAFHYRDLQLDVIETRNGLAARFGEEGGDVSEFTLEELVAELIFCTVHERMVTGFFRMCCEDGTFDTLLKEIKKRGEALPTRK